MDSDRIVFGAVTALFSTAIVVGCDRFAAQKQPPSDATATSQPAAAAPQPSSTGVTIVMDPDSKGVKVKGGTPITGDPKKCARFRACCKHPDASLFCGLLQAGPDQLSCSQALEKVKQLMKEQGATPPSGC